MEIITPREQIRKFFFEKHLEFLTSVPQQRLQEIILSSCMKGHSGKMSDYGECGPAHRTTYGHFLAKGKWDDKRLEETQKRESFQTVSELSRRDGTPLFISIDDTVLPKTVPSSKAKRPTQGAGWHYSHLEGKVVYGHQVHAAIVGTGDTSLCYSLKRCCPENGTKIDMTLEILRSLPNRAEPLRGQFCSEAPRSDKPCRSGFSPLQGENSRDRERPPVPPQGYVFLPGTGYGWFSSHQ